MKICGNNFVIRNLYENCFVMLVTIIYWVKFKIEFREVPRASKRQPTITDFNPLRTTANSAYSIRQPLLDTGICIFAITGIVSLAGF